VSPGQAGLDLLLQPGTEGVLEYIAEFSVVRLSKFCVVFKRADYIRTLRLDLLSADNNWLHAGTRRLTWALHEEPVCFAIQPGVYHGFRLGFTGGGGNVPQPMRALVSGAELSAASWLDRPAGALTIALLAALMLIGPGLFLTSLFSRENHTQADLLARIFPWSVVFFLLIYAGMWALQESDAGSGVRLIWLWAGVADVIVLLAALRLGIRGLARMLLSFLPAVLIYLVLVAGLTALLIHGLALPVWELDYQWINQNYTYGAFHAHDPVLHYVNGRAIADNEPFTVYYSNRRLLYYVEDRGILPGVLAAVYRQIQGEMIGLAGRTYGAYALFALACNAMLVFPVMAFVRRYMPSRSIVFGVLLVSLNAFVLVNYYLAWFKLAAAALFLSGLLILLSDNKSLRNWLLAGLSWGLAANMHAGSALMIPLFFLWQAFSLLRAGFVKGLIYPLLLCLIFAATIAPWSLVKARYYPDKHALLISHYLGGRENPDGLLASAKQLFREVPLSQQIKFRAHRVENALRITELKQVYQLFRSAGWRAALDEWNLREFRYTAFVVYPFLLFAVLARLFRTRDDDEIFRAAEHRLEISRARIMFWLSVTTLLVLLFLAYGRYDPDLTYHLPMALPVLMILTAVVAIVHGSRPVRYLFYGWVIFAAWRLALPYL